MRKSTADSPEGWWGGWLQQSFQAVKDKSTEALEFLKRDLTEFSTVVQHDTACSIAATACAVRNKLAVSSPGFLFSPDSVFVSPSHAQTVTLYISATSQVEGSSETTEKVKKSLSSFLGVISDTLAPPPDKTIDCDVITLVATPSGTTEVYDSSKARLYSLQADPATYCNEPDGPPEQFDNWLSSFSLEDKKGEISEHLVNSPSIRSLYTKMVPAAVSHSEFWQRYFYKVFQLDQEEARRVALKQRAEQTTHSETLGWEEEEEDDFLGASPSSSQLNFPPLFDNTSTQLPTTPTVPTGTSLLSPVLSPSEERDATLSVSSDSVSLPTQVDMGPEPVALQLANKLTEASLEDVALKTQETQRPAKSDLPPQPQVEAVSQPEVTVDGATSRTPASKPEPTKEEGPQDLRVFELNSDSGKSTPSNNGKKGSSTDVSEDWEKDFDLDMTEEEVQLALSKIEDTGELEEDWENWN
ncbi:BSD domain-containing protein 1 isoform X1 [Hippoglossus stenolepis]|uniref:BSD domain-containing protein 1 isoform X1 n=1 Tax=Hippoglossus stenolepis TaxID=195615 RepID=UPI001FAEB437|nr:BSD domain-containing protein 1 isoform X1 [Hippoglossus stenolepis]